MPPGAEAAEGEFGFVLGERRANVLDALALAVPSLARGRTATLVDASEAPDSSERTARQALVPPVSCDIPATRAGDPRFPLSQWEHDQTTAWIVTGSPGCAGDVVTELSAARARGVVALTLEAAALPAHGPGLRVVSATAGVVPEGTASDPRGDELRRFSAALGHLTWWTALGRDASTLARLALRDLPADLATLPATVLDRRRRARERLSAARARLWTTDSSGWSAAHTMPRSVCALDVRAQSTSR